MKGEDKRGLNSIRAEGGEGILPSTELGGPG